MGDQMYGICTHAHISEVGFENLKKFTQILKQCNLVRQKLTNKQLYNWYKREWSQLPVLEEKTQITAGRFVFTRWRASLFALWVMLYLKEEVQSLPVYLATLEVNFPSLCIRNKYKQTQSANSFLLFLLDGAGRGKQQFIIGNFNRVWRKKFNTSHTCSENLWGDPLEGA